VEVLHALILDKGRLKKFSVISYQSSAKKKEKSSVFSKTKKVFSLEIVWGVG
jgi:hypothetical protein